MDAPLLDRLRALFSGRTDVVEKRMVGGRAFAVGGRMCCGVTGDGLMVRVGRAQRDATLAEPHVRPLRMGERTVAAFVVVDPDAVTGDDDLAAWVRRAEDSLHD
ncbi:TfoX/Sxy family protein [Pseudonocardia sp.]|uniref:TfoX/Sxy family protein n=1 Tax=Pseudonocardia sp. TaxID=60912 RepID=UPI003D0E58A2